jgi:ribosomal protein S18 acetylase RimI-like enzyme
MTPIRIAEFTIRRCEPRDWDAVYHVCLGTGDDGKDATHLFDDPKVLGHIYVGPYMKLEPELAFVLADQQGVCGYVLGVLDSKKFYDAYRNEWLPGIRAQYPKPTGDPRQWNHTQRVCAEYYNPEIFWPEPYEDYPSHLHIDLLPRAQGRGLGREMMRVLLAALVERGSVGTYLAMALSNARAERFYKKLGFHELARRPEALYLGKRLP